MFSLQVPRALHRTPYLLLPLLFVAALLGLLFALPTAAAPEADGATHVFWAELTGDNEVPPVATGASGSAILTLDDDMMLHYRVEVSNIVSVTASHIHEGGPDENGPVVITLFDATGGGTFDPANPVVGSTPLTEAQLAVLLSGNYYVNVHTENVPSGEIRGQVEQQATDFAAVLNGENETMMVDTEAFGAGRLTIVNTDTFQVEVGVQEIVSITAAHIHEAPPGVDGPVLVTLYDGTGEFGPGNPISLTHTMTDNTLLASLFDGTLYVNVHTVDNPAGEIRGQLEPGTLRAFRASLAGANEVPPVTDTVASGQALVTLSPDLGALHYRVMVNDIEDIAAAHIHTGAIGVNGGVAIGLYDGTGAFDPDNPVSGTADLTIDQAAVLLAGNYYVNVHTPDNPAGEIRGQLEAYTPTADYSALLTGAEEVPPVESDAVGVARLSMDGTGALSYNVAVTGIVSATGAHIHTGWPGENGPIAFDLLNGDTLGTNDPVSGTVSLDAWDLLNLLSGYYYVNVHTAENPGGEIRGQVRRAHLFDADLSGDQEVPPVETEAGGRAILAVNATADELVYRVMVRDIMSVTAAHIHLGAPGVNGGVVFGLFDASGGGTFDAGNPVSGTIALTDADLFDMLAGNYYVNVHTTDNPAGEIRGQIRAFEPSSDYEATLTGEAEVPPVTTAASGEGRFKLNTNTHVLHYSVDVSDIVSITASHIHKAPAGVNGGIIFGLYAGSSSPVSFGPDQPIAGCLSLNAQNLVDLLTEFYYVNVHTSEYPAGEIRGQIVRTPDMLYLPFIPVE